MKIFVIHSGSDEAEVKDYLDRLKKETVSTEVLMMGNNGKLWKIDSGKKIRLSQLVLVFVGEKTHLSKNVEWEINKAYQLGKEIISVCLRPDYELPPALKKALPFSGEKTGIGANMSFDEVVKFVQSYTDWDYSLFNMELQEDNLPMLFEQYKVFLQTSETLVARRQSVSNFYISVNSAIVTVFSTVLALLSNTAWKYIACLAFPVVGIILCFAWARILRSYGNLNASKMRIISIIERRLPASLYDAEWRVQSDKLNAKPYVSFTESEIRIPKIFIMVYGFIILVLSAVLLYHWLGMVPYY